MRILYGVVGEGMGHAMRSRVMLEHLVAGGHDVVIMTSGRAVEFLQKHFKDVRRIHGLQIVYEENRVKPLKTLWHNVRAGATGLPKNVVEYFKLLGDFKPDAVISDFESWAYYYAKAHRLPILSIDNIQVIDRCVLPPEVVRKDKAQFHLARAIVKAKLPRCNQYFITAFAAPKIRKKNTAIFPPILRAEILAATPTRGDHLLVYTTGENNTAIAETLRASGHECRIYGMRRDLKEEVVDGNLRYRAFSEAGFIHDLASCRAVIAGGGYTVMGEAVYLHKPMLSVPAAGQFEQIVNARFLELEGYGKAADTLDDPAIIADFLASLPRYEEKLAKYHQKGNERVLHALDDWLEKINK